MSNDDEFRVWIGCLACYNGGNLVGEWYPASEAGEITTEIIHATANLTPGYEGDWHEELWVMDLDNAPLGCHHEMSPVEAQQIADKLEEIPEDQLEPFAAWAENLGYSFIEAEYSDFEDAYCGEWDSREDYAQELADDLGLLPESFSWPASYIDWERAASDLFMDYTAIAIPGGGIWVFRNN